MIYNIEHIDVEDYNSWPRPRYNEIFRSSTNGFILFLFISAEEDKFQNYDMCATLSDIEVYDFAKDVQKANVITVSVEDKKNIGLVSKEVFNHIKDMKKEEKGNNTNIEAIIKKSPNNITDFLQVPEELA